MAHSSLLRPCSSPFCPDPKSSTSLLGSNLSADPGAGIDRGATQTRSPPDQSWHQSDKSKASIHHPAIPGTLPWVSFRLLLARPSWLFHKIFDRAPSGCRHSANRLFELTISTTKKREPDPPFVVRHRLDSRHSGQSCQVRATLESGLSQNWPISASPSDFPQVALMDDTLIQQILGSGRRVRKLP